MKIGIPGWENDEFFGVSANYMNFAEYVGSPVVLSPDPDKNLTVDGILLPGGSDVNPSRYGIPGFYAQKSNPYLEWFDDNILPDAIANNIPVFGICRGLQTLNVFFGGNLHQHLPFHPYSGYETDTVHEVFYEKTGKKEKVNSFHHQGIKALGKDLQIVAQAVPSGLIEAFTHKSLRVAAVQWHPERLHDEESIALFRSLFR